MQLSDEALVTLTANVSALTHIVTQAGLCTDEEFEAMVDLLKSHIEQTAAEKRDADFERLMEQVEAKRFGSTDEDTNQVT